MFPFCALVLIFSFGITHSPAQLEIDTPNCAALYHYLDNNSTQSLFAVNLERMKVMMAASQRSGEKQVNDMDTEGVLLLFDCLKENVQSNTLIKVPTELSILVSEMFVIPYLEPFAKYTSFTVELLDEDGALQLNVTCTTKSAITLPDPLTLLCDFGDEDDEEEGKSLPLKDRLALLG
ncbi:uncharacterized protein LOC119660884 [Hermetia illucens]|uniref:uncharacterized protein LOC119660884 n=1 Tax=Hermetia illucens TaxID=343691 RepID=UPI0018CC17F4|nr:uncharacterized protein LOC119660884 [Hermetia illucens]